MSGRRSKLERKRGERLSPEARAAEREFARIVEEHMRSLEPWRRGRERRQRFAATVGLALFVCAMVLLALTVVIE